MVEMVLAIAGNVKVDIAVIIVIGSGDSHAEALALQPGALSHIFKSSVGFLMIESIPESGIALVRRRAFGHWILQQGAVREKNIHAPIVVVIKNRNAATHCLQ